MKVTVHQIINTLDRDNKVSVVGATISDEIAIVRKQQGIVVTFRDCIFTQPVSFHLDGGNFHQVDLGGSEFHEGVEIYGLSSNVIELSFVGATFRKGFNLNCKTRMDLDCSKSHWYGQIAMEQCAFRNLICVQMIAETSSYFHAPGIHVSEAVTFADSQFGEVHLRQSIFEVSVSFDRCMFKSLDCMDAVFKDDLYLNYTEFGEKVFFNATQIQGKVIAPFVNQKSERCIADFPGVHSATVCISIHPPFISLSALGVHSNNLSRSIIQSIGSLILLVPILPMAAIFHIQDTHLEV